VDGLDWLATVKNAGIVTNTALIVGFPAAC
jgi:hypothetical protein